MTQAQLGEAVDSTGNVISQLESETRGLSAKWLRRLAPILGTTPGILLDYAPSDELVEMVDSFRQVEPGQRRQVIEVVKGFRKTA